MVSRVVPSMAICPCSISSSGRELPFSFSTSWLVSKPGLDLALLKSERGDAVVGVSEQLGGSVTLALNFGIRKRTLGNGIGVSRLCCSTLARSAADVSAEGGYSPLWMNEQMLKGCEVGTKLRVAVLLSGGVDSSVALRLLVAAGHECTAYYLKIWFQVATLFLPSLSFT